MGKASKILLGMGNSLDYDIVWQPQAIASLAEDWGIDTWPEPPLGIHSEPDLLCAILAYSAAGIGTERAVDSVDVIESTARKLGFRESVGGTGVRAGRVLDLLGIDCTVHLSSVPPDVELLLWRDARYLTGRQATAPYPHLIVQFTADQALTIGGIARTPPRPNRLIFVNDPDNSELDFAPALPEAVSTSSIWLISGINAIADKLHLDTRLGQLQTLTRTMRPGSWVVYEDSGFHHQVLASTALSAMADVCDVVGMNEDEFVSHLGTPVDLDDPESVRPGLTALARKWNIKNLVVHTARWAAVIGPQSEQLRPALINGVLAGAARFTKGDAMTEDDLAQLGSAPPNPNGVAVVAGLERAGMTAVAAPELSPREPVTVGLGDSFVGGFLAGLYRSGVRANPDGRTRSPVAPPRIEEPDV